MKQAIKTPSEAIYNTAVKHCIDLGMKWQNKGNGKYFDIFEDETILHINNGVLSVGYMLAEGYELINSIDEII